MIIQPTVMSPLVLPAPVRAAEMRAMTQDSFTLSQPGPSPAAETVMGMTAKQWSRVGLIAVCAAAGSLVLAPFGGGLVSQGIAGAWSGCVLGNGLSNRGPFSDGVNACINLASAAAGMFGIPLLGSAYGVVAAAGASAAVAGIGAAVIGCGPIRNYSTTIVTGLHEYIRKEDYEQP